MTCPVILIDFSLPIGRKQEEESLKMALELSKQETVTENDEQQDQTESNTGGVTDLIGTRSLIITLVLSEQY